ncbi:EamA family transporter [Bradyrhizobium sp. U87765 SZCCT0131]|uniref:DMT family transporter n=1 Tax=unclassified Bradyrhizobium TaxID=2631580 RepID=UPI001BA78446|nr:MULTISPECIES: EamA family transporter [unclassified Bradyrhizobium]MBR1216594.1 EamA family transporter [Bradyrhizobium sp. U87765 SZCCT0131]MBR1259650.1 EamA family transporter [Bradyrhizobium sp. U87765 SZCCT0134]MBR1305791.1 EamA family transporter [Bradyrhizobium sp. U87765 SZCCT0110]MBR1322158.1 EamA family transporter [Bradyrhizobium sp. U87765 SZCCT0109]MBR1350563.1 EamA family transporter [Bradyrhizobium sp. U87765 SZCCT0048]
MTSAVGVADRSRYTANLALLLALATVWAGSYIFIKLGVATIPPVTLIAARTLIAGSILLAILRLRGVALPRDGAVWGRFMIQACFNSVLPFTLIAWAEHEVDAGLATILSSNAPIFTFLLALVFLRHDPPTPRQLFGVAAGLAGICLVVGLNALSGLGQQVLPQLALVGAAVSFGGAAIFGRNFSGLDPMVPAAGSMICGAAMLVPASLLFDHPWTLSPSAMSVGALIGLAVVSTALAFVIYFHLIQTLGPVGTSAQAYLRVPIGVVLSVVVLGERPSATAWLGLVCVIVGIAAMTVPSRGKRAPIEPESGG